jgi:hypothetical protein
LTNLLQGKLGNWDTRSVHLRSRLSHIIRRQQRSDGAYVQIPLDGNLEAWHLEESLPSPSEQLDQLILSIGDYQPSPAESAHLAASALSAEIGAYITRKSPNADLGWLLAQNDTMAMLESRGEENGAMLLRLKMSGWVRYDILKRGRIAGRNVLMVMQFNDAELDHAVDQCFRPAVQRTGFELCKLNEKQSAGLIDDQLRVALRTSRFVIADMTHGNNGAYWESGFAEGLGRPVIYTCREKEWTERKTHFDTNHLVTVIWRVDKLDKAGDQLTATIRATLPEDAKMTDH